MLAALTDKASGSLIPKSDRASARIGQVVVNRYRLEALLGTGATGAVYRAAHPGGHKVAVKILDPSLMESEVAQRFVRESQLMLSIHHPHVVRTLAAGRDDTLKILYLVMPLLKGEDLDAVIQRCSAIDPTAAVRIAIQAARGIGAAHRLGVVHRDIKPGNLFLDTAADGRLSVRVCDFGIAKTAFGGGDVGITRTGTQLGTPDYISPEQLKDSKTVDARADIWGLGTTLYELLCGHPPFAHHGRVFDVIAAILSEEIAWLQDRAPWIDAELATVVHRALRRDPEQRYGTMEAFADALLVHSSGDSGLTQAQLTSVSPILRKVKKARGQPPAAHRAPAGDKLPDPPGSSSTHEIPGKSAQAKQVKGGTKARKADQRAHAKAPRGLVGRVFGTMFLLAFAVAGTLVWLGILDWRVLYEGLMTQVQLLTDR